MENCGKVERKQWKWQLVRQLFEQVYSREDILQLFRLIDWMMTLPEKLEEEFRTPVEAISGGEKDARLLRKNL